MYRIITSITLILVLLISGCRPFQERDIRNAIEARLADDAADQLLASAYDEIDYAPLWVETNALTDDGEAFLDRVMHAHLDALPPEDYPADSLLEESRILYADPPEPDTTRADALASLELRISELFLQYADHLANGRIDHREKLTGYHVRHDRLDPTTAFRRIEQTNVNNAVDAFAARRAGQPQLRAALARYHEVAADGGWPAVSADETLQPDDEGPEVAELHRRLAAEGFMEPVDGNDRFDERTEEAVQRFQQSRGIAETASVDAATRAALNRPIDGDIEQIVVNIERLRALPSDFGDRYIFVNIPNFRLSVIEDDREVMTMRVVVGEQMHPTPVFADTMTYLAFSPYWNVPTGLANREIVPAARNDPDYLPANGYEIVGGFHPGASVYEPTSGNVGRVAVGELFVRQVPGPRNALGGVKFMFPNEYAIYLHDTPSGHLFREEDRGFSNGCIRVERPVALAEYLLEPNGGWSRDRIESSMGLSDEKTVSLDSTIPVYLMYLTAWVDARGDVQFRDDIYGHDARLKEELEGVVDEIMAE